MNCIECEKEFTPAHGRETLCSDACRGARQRRRNRDHQASIPRDQVAKRQREYYGRHKEKVKASVTRWRKNNPDKAKAISDRTREKNKDKITARVRDTRAKQRVHKDPITKECIVCDKSFSVEARYARTLMCSDECKLVRAEHLRNKKGS